MEVEIGLKITQTRDDLTSTSDLRIAKDAGGPVFLSKETENMFILTAHLKGYRREHIDIQINEDGTRIVVGGKKPVQEKVMIGLVLYKKEVELRGFRKVFKIPQGVVLDKIKAKFNRKGSILTVSMPKSVGGISGNRIEEVEEMRDSKSRHETSSEAIRDDYKDSDSMTKDIAGGAKESPAMTSAEMEGDRAPERSESLREKAEKNVVERQAEETSRETVGAENNGENKLDTIPEKSPSVPELEQQKRGVPQSPDEIEPSTSTATVLEPKEADVERKDNEQKLPSTAENHIREKHCPSSSESSEALKEELKEYHSSPKNISTAQTEADRLTQESGSQPDSTRQSKLKEGPQLTKPKEDEQPVLEEQTDESKKDVDMSEPIKDTRHEDPGDKAVVRKHRRKKCKICFPAVAGSAILASIIVVAFHLIKANRK